MKAKTLSLIAAFLLFSCKQKIIFPRLEMPRIKSGANYYSSIRLKKSYNCFSLPLLTDKKLEKSDIEQVRLDNHPIDEYELSKVTDTDDTKYFLDFNVKEEGKYEKLEIQIGDKNNEYPVNLVIEDEKQYNKEYTFSCKEIKIEKEYGLTSFTAFYNRKFSDPIELDIKNKDGYELPQYKGSAQLLFNNIPIETMDYTAELEPGKEYTLKLSFYENETTYYFDENLIFHVKDITNQEEGAISLNSSQSNRYSTIITELFS